MRAILHDRYGSPDVLRVAEVEKPVATGNRVLIRVDSASVNRSDWENLTGWPSYVRLSGSGFTKPKNPRLGSDVAGTVEAVGPEVTRFKPGDEVFGDILYHGMGAFAEYVAPSETAPLAIKPVALSFEQAATLPQSGVLAIRGIRKWGNVSNGDRVAVVGAGGGAGHFAVQIAKAHGASVTGVDSGDKAELLRSLGASDVVDYRSNNYLRTGVAFDRIVDYVGPGSIFSKVRSLRPGGAYMVAGGSVPALISAFAVGGLMSLLGDRRLGVLIAQPKVDDLVELAHLTMAGTITPAIERVYSLEEVPQALEHLGAGKVLGKLVVRP